MEIFDLIVIGAGPGGYEAAFEASDLGMKTALIEKNMLGGTCLNQGCIPTKSLLYSAELYRCMRNADEAGISTKELSFDLNKMQQHKNKAIEQLRKGIEYRAKEKKVNLIHGTAKLCGEGKVLVCGEDNEQILRAKNILFATGSQPIIPPIEGIHHSGVMTSNELLEFDKPINRLVIIGGGVIGVEFATLYEALNTKVTLIEAMPQLLPQIDREIAQSVKMLLKKRGIDVFTGARVNEICREAEAELVCKFSTEAQLRTVGADAVLLCVGRQAYTDELFPDNIKPDMNHGHICVNERYETSIPGVYAVGDVIGGTMLAHAATAEGRNAVRMMAGNSKMIDTRWIPACIYTAPEIACIGMTVEEAKNKGINVDSRKVSMGSNGKTVVTSCERGFIRVVYEKATRKLLGAQMMCERATDMISEFTQALSLGLTMEDMSCIIRPHPTFSEAITDAVKR